MKLLPLLTIFVLGLLFCSSSLADDLEQSLRAQLDDANKSEASLFYRVPFASQRMYYYVPPALASILESHTDAELVPALTALKSSVGTSDALLVQNWIAVAKSQVRGTPSTVRVSSGFSARSVPVVLYALPVHSHHP